MLKLMGLKEDNIKNKYEIAWFSFVCTASTTISVVLGKIEDKIKMNWNLSWKKNLLHG